MQQAAYIANGLQIGNKLFQITSTTPGTLTFSSNGSSFQLQRVNSVPQGPQPVIFNAPIVNQPPRVPQLSVKRSNRLPTEMQGTWYEVTQDSQGQRVLNRYELDAAGSYEMLQFSISAQNDVDLNSPIAQLSQIASAQQRTLAYQDGQLSLGKFHPCPLAAVPCRRTHHSAKRQWPRWAPDSRGMFSWSSEKLRDSPSEIASRPAHCGAR